jgi:hypothetical protein
MAESSSFSQIVERDFRLSELLLLNLVVYLDCLCRMYVYIYICEREIGRDPDGTWYTVGTTMLDPGFSVTSSHGYSRDASPACLVIRPSSLPRARVPPGPLPERKPHDGCPAAQASETTNQSLSTSHKDFTFHT